MAPTKPPIEPLRPTGGTRSKRHRGLPSIVVLRQASVDRMPGEDSVLSVRNEHASAYLVKPFFVQREKAKKGSTGALLVKEAKQSRP